MTNNCLPCDPNYDVRPHSVHADDCDKLREWLNTRNGIVVYIPYPVKGMKLNPIFAPLETDAYYKNPADDYIWENGSIKTTEDGTKLVYAPRTKLKSLNDVDVYYVAIDTICPTFENISEEELFTSVLTTSKQ